MSVLLPTHRVHELVSLLGSCAELPLHERREHLTRGIARLVGADGVLVLTVDDYAPHTVHRTTSVLSKGFEGGHGARLLASIWDRTYEDPIVAIGARLGAGAYRRRDLLGDREWYATRWVREEFHTMGFDDGIYTRVALTDRQTECTAAFRELGSRPFTSEECALLDVLTKELPRLLRSRLSPRFVEAKLGLSPREAQTLERLCRGESEKQVANALGISHHTVHTYVKALYQHFGVVSRSELLAQFIGGPSEER